MKKIIIGLVALLSIFFIAVAFKNSGPTHYQHCEIVGTSNLIGTKVKVDVDFGQEKNYWKANESKIKDEEGNIVKFNSMVDAMNYMGEQGWEYVDSYAISTHNGPKVYHYLLRRPITE